jgi:hypothetical protein
VASHGIKNGVFQLRQRTPVSLCQHFFETLGSKSLIVVVTVFSTGKSG